MVLGKFQNLIGNLWMHMMILSSYILSWIALSLLLKLNSQIFRNIFTLRLTLKNKTDLIFKLSKILPTIPFSSMKTKEFTFQLIFVELAFGLLIFHCIMVKFILHKYSENTNFIGHQWIRLYNYFYLNVFALRKNPTDLPSLFLPTDISLLLTLFNWYALIFTFTKGILTSLWLTSIPFCIVVQSKQAAHVKLAFDKFCAAYATPENVLSDNGGEFELIPNCVTTPSERP